MPAARRRRAFTLIELLIMVAIIAILAAIAVPNFLEAQTRAKVTRAVAEMRTVTIAVEAYRVDQRRYALPDDIAGGAPDLNNPPTFFETKVPTRLTTPVAYTTRIPEDMFRNLKETDETYLPYHYATRDFSRLTTTVDGGEQEFDALYLAMMGTINSSAQWYMLSHGPDSDHDAGPSNGVAPGLPGHISGDGVVAYDPTNGTISNGDLVFWGPGVGRR